MKKLSFILVCFLLLFCNCKKDKVQPSAAGTVVDATTGSPVSGAKVYLVEEENCWSWQCPAKIIADQTTGSDGKYSIKYEKRENYIYYLKVTASRYYENNNAEFGRVALQPEACLKVILKNTNPYDSWDEIYLDPYGLPGSNCGSAGGSGGTFQGTSVDTFKFGGVYGNRETALYWTVTKNSILTEFRGSIYCPAFDTTVYQINY